METAEESRDSEGASVLRTMFAYAFFPIFLAMEATCLAFLLVGIVLGWIGRNTCRFAWKLQRELAQMVKGIVR